MSKAGRKVGVKVRFQRNARLFSWKGINTGYLCEGVRLPNAAREEKAMTIELSRRSVMGALACVSFFGPLNMAYAQPVQMKVFKDASCGCCGAWIAYIRQAGFFVEASNMPDMEAIKQRYKVPEELYSCHTALIGRYVIEGHVPVSAIRRLLAEQPSIIGLSAPGMPTGSPGMETPEGYKEPYDVVAFSADGTKLFARFIGDKEV